MQYSVLDPDPDPDPVGSGFKSPPGSGSGFRMRIRIHQIKFCSIFTTYSSVSDPHSFNPDPEPGFFFNLDPIEKKPGYVSGLNACGSETLLNVVKILQNFPGWIRIRIPNADWDLDPGGNLNEDPCGSGSRTLGTA